MPPFEHELGLAVVSRVDDLRDARDPNSQCNQRDPEARRAVNTEDGGEGQVVAGRRHCSADEGGDAANGGDCYEPYMYGPPIESQLFSKGVWRDQQEEGGESDEESDCTIGVEGVPHGRGYTRGGERPPGGQGAEHDAYGADSTQASTATAAKEVP